MAPSTTEPVTRRPWIPHVGSDGFVASVLEELRVLIVAGVVYGAIVAGLGSRQAMLLLRLTSPESVIGLRSDDDFVIGRFTLGGSYGLVALGAFVGVLGAGAYRLVRPWLIGPMWFRRATTGLASGAVVGSMLIHADGIDFRLLKPTWLAISLFIALPAAFGTFIGPVVDRVARADSWTRAGRRRWMLPVISLLAFPPLIIATPFVAALIAEMLALRRVGAVERLRATASYGLVMRGAWLGIAVLGLFVLVEDITEITRVV
jgi:hypothetical protein